MERNNWFCIIWNKKKSINGWKGNAKAEYGAASLKLLSKELTNLYGRGFSRSNLQSMRKF